MLSSPYAPRSVIDNTAVQSGPFGYTDKGSFFSDMAVTEFPKWIEVIYQGFVWAIRVTYPSNGSLMHGGVHTILKDKVKKQKFFLKDGEHIVRVSGRASPYNINRYGWKKDRQNVNKLLNRGCVSILERN